MGKCRVREEISTEALHARVTRMVAEPEKAATEAATAVR
jgi:hypothetical protein